MSVDIAHFGLFEWFFLLFSVYIISLIQIGKSGLCNFSKNRKVGAWMAVFALILLASMRTGIGDTMAYVQYYQMVPRDFSAFFSTFTLTGEWGFQLLMFISKQFFGSNINFYLFFLAVISVGCICAFFIKYSEMPSMAMFLYLASGLYITNLNGTRQSLVTGIFIAFIGLVVKKRYVLFIILCLALSTVHSSALILLPVIWVFNFKPWGRGTRFLLLAGIALYAFYPLFSTFLSNIMVSNEQYSVYSAGIVGGKGDLGANFLRAVIKFVPVGMAYLERKKLKDKAYFSVFLHASILDFIFMLLATAKSWIFARMCIYMAPFSIILLCWAIKEAKRNNRIVLYLGCMAAYAIFFWYELMSSVLLY